MTPREEIEEAKLEAEQAIRDILIDFAKKTG